MRELTQPRSPWWWEVIPQVVRGGTGLLESRREPVTPWGTEALLAELDGERVTVAGTLVDAIARLFRVQRRVPTGAAPSALLVRRAVRWRAFHEARRALSGTPTGWRWRDAVDDPPGGAWPAAGCGRLNERGRLTLKGPR